MGITSLEELDRLGAAIEAAAPPEADGPSEREQSAASEAFNLGSDARLAGLPSHSNPYTHSALSTAAWAWERGWKDVDQSWGDSVRGRWTVKPLPRVR